jgi:8-oxo-dGTP diphosphatase
MSNHTRRVGTNILLVRNGQVLLPRRANTGWADGKLGIPGGHLEEGETARQAAIRELQEELGITIGKDRLVFFATAIVNSNHEYVYEEFFVELEDDETPVNAEPDKCSGLVWCDPNNLPDDVAESFRMVIQQGYIGGARYLEIGY